MINHPIDRIDKAVIEGLVSSGVPESRTLDYKDKLPSGKNDDRKEFLADVSAMANASGGDIVFGVAERREEGKPTGIPESVVGLGDVNLDAEKLRLENWLRDMVDPRIIGLQMHPVEGFDGGAVLVIRVPKSYNAPHMVKGGDSRFYSRNSSGKYPLDVTEIRSAFILSEALPERIRNFRIERLAKIAADESPVKLASRSRTVLHVLPLSAFSGGENVDISVLRTNGSEFAPLCGDRLSGSMPRYNLDGSLTYGWSGDYGNNVTYIQLFRNGAIEAVECLMLSPSRGIVDQPLCIPSEYFEASVIRALDRFVKLLQLLHVEPPVVVALGLIGALGHRLAPPQVMSGYTNDYPVDRDPLVLPECLLQDFRTPADKVLQPAFDALWQSVGYERALLYRDDGKGRWSSRRDGKPLLDSPA